MSQTISPVINKPYGIKRVCEVWDLARSTFYRDKAKNDKEPAEKRGPKPLVKAEELLSKIQDDIKSSPFKGEGHRKIHARLKRQGTKVGRNRVLYMMRENQLLSPHRSLYRPPNPHDGKITTEAPNIMWGSDGTKVQTVDDGWVWVFSVAEHWNTECLGWHTCKVGDRFAAVEPISQAVKEDIRIFNQRGGCRSKITNRQWLAVYFGLLSSADRLLGNREQLWLAKAAVNKWSSREVP